MNYEKPLKIIYISLAVLSISLITVFGYITAGWLIRWNIILWTIILIFFAIFVFSILFYKFEEKKPSAPSFVLIILLVCLSTFFIQFDDYQPYQCCSAFSENYNNEIIEIEHSPLLSFPFKKYWCETDRIIIYGNQSLDLPVTEEGEVHVNNSTSKMNFTIENKYNHTLDIKIDITNFMDLRYEEFYYCDMYLIDRGIGVTSLCLAFDFYRYTDYGGYDYESCNCERIDYWQYIRNVELKPFEKRRFTLEYTFEKTPEVEKHTPNATITAYSGTYQDGQNYNGSIFVFDGEKWGEYNFEVRT